MLLHEGLRESFASFKARAGGSGAYYEDARFAQSVCCAGDKRRLRADEYELYAEPGAELFHRLGIARVASVAERKLRYAWVAGAAVELGRYLRARKGMDYGVFAAAAPEYHNFHSFYTLTVSGGMCGCRRRRG